MWVCLHCSKTLCNCYAGTAFLLKHTSKYRQNRFCVRTPLKCILPSFKLKLWPITCKTLWDHFPIGNMALSSIWMHFLPSVFQMTIFFQKQNCHIFAQWVIYCMLAWLFAFKIHVNVIGINMCAHDRYQKCDWILENHPCGYIWHLK